MKPQITKVTVEYEDGSTETIPCGEILKFDKDSSEIGLKFEPRPDTFAIVAKGQFVYLF